MVEGLSQADSRTALQVTEAVLISLLQRENVDSHQRVSLQRASQDVQHLLKIETTAHYEISIGEQIASETRYYAINFGSDWLNLSSGGSVYNPAVLSNSFSDFDLNATANGNFEMEGDLSQWHFAPIELVQDLDANLMTSHED